MTMATPTYLTISCSLDPNSYSFVLAQHVHQELSRHSGSRDFIDLRTYPLPISNGSGQSAYADPNVRILHDRILAAQGIILATPIYNYGVNAACKNLIELTGTTSDGTQSGDAWRHKVIGLIAVAGGEGSYMAPMGVLHSLMLDFRSVVIPRYVYATQSHFINHRPSPEMEARVAELADTMALFVHGLEGYISSARC